MVSLTSRENVEAAADTVPRPEYPRPQFVRPEWLNLNGEWELEFDDQDVGIRDKWYSRGDPFSRNILVPFSFETRKSRIHDLSFHSCVWYRRQIAIPSEWLDRRILLHFGAVDYRTTVWVNGGVIAMHEGGHVAFTCDITHARNNGRNLLVVRAEDPPTDRYIPRGKQHWKEDPVSIFYARTTGIWQQSG